MFIGNVCRGHRDVGASEFGGEMAWPWLSREVLCASSFLTLPLLFLRGERRVGVNFVECCQAVSPRGVASLLWLTHRHWRSAGASTHSTHDISGDRHHAHTRIYIHRQSSIIAFSVDKLGC